MESDLDLLGGLHEQAANQTIANWLGTQREWRADAERVGVMQGGHTRPDILILEGDRMPVIVETEYSNPAVSDAESRLGEKLVNETRPFTEVIALGIDEKVKNTTPEFLTELLEANKRMFTVQFVSQRNGTVYVWPDAPLPATPADLVAYCEYAQVPQSVIEAKSAAIAERVRAAGRKIEEGIRFFPDGGKSMLGELMDVLGCDTSTAATQTSCAIWMIAIDLQNDLAAYSTKLANLGLKGTGNETLTKSALLRAWEIIKSVNYLPVVELAISSLETIPPRTIGLSDVLSELAELSDELNGLHAKHIYNFAGELWQKLVVDREERAAHYTKPEVAELLATLGAVRFSGRSADELFEVDLMDAACGTGTLIGAGERSLRRLYRFKGGQSDELHKKRMENHVIAVDVNGIAGTLTAKRLTDMDVQQTYDGAKIAVTDHPAGSLSLLDPNETGISRVLGYRNVTQTMDAKENLGLFHIGIEESGVDWSLMNPPYSKPRKGRTQPTKGLNRLRPAAKRAGYTMSHGQAGLATDFGNVSLMRLKGGGVFAHVLPMTAAYAGSWQQWRVGIETHFENIVAITNTGRDRLTSMSADTGMSEMLLVATKRKGKRKNSAWRKSEILCVNLYTPPTTLSEGYALANEIASIPENEISGISNRLSFARIDTLSPGFSWYGIGNSNVEISAVICGLIRGEIYYPHTLSRRSISLDMTTLGAVGRAGPTHDLLGHPVDGDGRGAFKWIPITALGGDGVHTHKSMWAAESKTQRQMVVNPTHAGQITNENLAKQMLEKRSQWFLNRGVSWTSQSLLVAKTEQNNHGGRAWNALQGLSESTGVCVALFYNSIFGALMMRAYAQSPQQGPRASIQIGAIPGLPCPSFGASTPQAKRARTLASMWFDSLSKLELRPFSYCFADESRHQIDNTVADMLGLDSSDPDTQQMLAHYRRLFASESNINGGQEKILVALDRM